jgi:hypothetical protein
MLTYARSTLAHAKSMLAYAKSIQTGAKFATCLTHTSWRWSMSDSTIDPMDLLWRILVAVLLLAILAGPGVKVLMQLTMLRDSSFVPTAHTLLAVDF